MNWKHALCCLPIALIAATAWPCSGNPYEDWSVPRSGSTGVPSNLPAFLVGVCPFPEAPSDAGIRLVRALSDGGVQLVDISVEGTTSSLTVTPRESFSEGEEVRLENAPTCQQPSQPITWTFGPAWPSPVPLMGGLIVSAPRRGRVDVGNSSICHETIDGVWVTIELAPGALDPQWFWYEVQTLRIDGTVWAGKAPWFPEQGPVGAGGTVSGRLWPTVSRVHAPCGASKRTQLGLTEGDHVAELSVKTLGMEPRVVSAPFTLRCSAPPGDAKPLRIKPPDWDESVPGCGCSTSALSPLLLGVLALLRRRQFFGHSKSQS